MVLLHHPALPAPQEVVAARNRKALEVPGQQPPEEVGHQVQQVAILKCHWYDFLKGTCNRGNIVLSSIGLWDAWRLTRMTLWGSYITNSFPKHVLLLLAGPAGPHSAP